MPDQPESNAAQVQPAQQADSAWLLGGRYRILDRLGLGGMAEVFRAHDDLLDRDVAVKVFRSGVGGDDDTHGEVRRELELQSLARLSHPNLITLFDGSVAGDGPAYLVLELVNGPDLASRLREGPLSEPEVRELGAQIADALAYVHARGMVHRDVKPANILLGVDEAMPGAVRSRLSDFGIVRMIGSERLTSVDMTLGTASYIAPEQAKGANVGPAADVYSLALVLIESLTGVRCFDGPVHEALAARLTTAPQIPPGLPTPWPELLAAMTVQDPDDRPPAAEVARSLRAGVPPAVTPVADVLADMSPRTAAATVAAAGLTAVGGGVAGAAAAVPTGASAATPTGAFAAAPTGRFAPVATGAVPVAMTGPAGRPPPVTYAPWDDEPYDGDVRRGRRGMTLVLAAIAFAALMAGAGFLLLGGSPSSPADTSTTTTTTSQPSAPKTTAPRRKTSEAAVVASTHSRSSSKSHTASKSATPSRSSVARTSSAAPSSSAPVTSSSAASSSSSAPPTTSPPAPSGTGVAAGAMGSPAPPTP